MITEIRKGANWRVAVDDGEHTATTGAPVLLQFYGVAVSVNLHPRGCMTLGNATVWLPREVAAELGVLPRAEDTRIERAIALVTQCRQKPFDPIIVFANLHAILSEPAP